MRKRKIFSIVLCLVFFCCILSGCGKDKVEFNINFVVDGEVYATVSTSGNEEIEMPEYPVKDGYVFDDWYWDYNGFSMPFYASTLSNEKLTKDIEVYAEFKPNYGLYKINALSNDFTKDPDSGFPIYNKIVSNTTDEMDLTNIVTTTSGTWNLCGDITGETVISNKIVALNIGDNTYYVSAYFGESRACLCQLNIRRKPVYTVSFNVNGGSFIESQDIEEGCYISRPEQPRKCGYNFIGFSENINDIVVSNMVVDVNWQPNTYEIHYHDGGNIVVQNVVYDSQVELKSADLFVKEYYNFVSWNTQVDLNGDNYSANTVFSEYKFAEDINLYAQWVPINYEITYHLFDGANNINNISIYNVETQEFTLFNASKHGYNFIGWYLDSEFKNNISKIEAYSHGNLDLYAKFEKCNYTINYYLGGGTNNSNNPQNYTIDSQTITLQNPNKTGYTFAGWYNNAEFAGNAITEIANGTTGNINLYAKFVIINCSISYELNGGENSNNNPSSFDINSGEIILEPPTKLGYSFDGWYDNAKFTGSPITKINTSSLNNYKFYAKWAIIQYNIVYHLFNGNNDVNNHSTYNIEDQDITLFNASKVGYSFKGWYLDSEFKNSISKIEAGSYDNLDIYAKFELINYQINYVLNGGTNNSENKLTYTIEDETFELKQPNKLAYDFVTWDNGGVITKGSHGDITFTASWKATEYNIVYILGGGTNSLNNPSKYSIECDDIVFEDATRLGYSFKCWDINKIKQGSYGDKTITASWIPLSYKVSYVLEDGINNPQNVKSYTIESGDITLYQPTKTGYTFKGWTGTGLTDKTMIVIIPAGSVGDKEFTANWELANYSIIYVLNNGANNDDNITTYTIETPTFTLSDPTKAHYEFVEWQCNGEKVTEITKGSFGDKELTAIWIPVNYNISYQLNGGSANNVEQYNIETSTFTLKNPTKPGYTFEGWTGTGLTDKTLIVEISKTSVGNRSYEAHWVINTYTITYELNNGTIEENINPSSYTYEDKIVLGSPTRNYCKFTGWFIGSSQVTEIYHNYYEDLTITASWECAFTISGNKIIGITDYGKTLNSLTIPSDLDGVTINGIGPDAFKNCTNFTNIIVPKSVKTIGNNAFSGCSSLMSITLPIIPSYIGILFGSSNYYDNSTYLPASLTSMTFTGGTIVENYSFFGCENLISITIPEGVTIIDDGAFENCLNLIEMIIPESIISIGDSVFWNCNKLKYVDNNLVYIKTTTNNHFYLMSTTNTSRTSATIHKDCKFIANNALGGCDKLSNLYYTGTIADWCNMVIGCNAISGVLNKHFFVRNGEEWQEITELVIPEGITEIKPYTFQGFGSLISVTMSDDVISVGDFAFEECIGLTSFSFSNNVYNIGDYALSYCIGLTNVTIPNSVRYIGESAFRGCSSFTSIIIPKNVISIGDDAFKYCYGMFEIYNLSSLNISKGSQSNGLVGLYAKNIYTNLEEVSKLIISNGIKYYIDSKSKIAIRPVDINSSSFVIDDDCTDINSRAFYGCMSLLSISIPSSVVTIGREAFGICVNLTNIAFGSPSGWYKTYSLIDWNNKNNGTNVYLGYSTDNVSYFVYDNTDWCWYKI